MKKRFLLSYLLLLIGSVVQAQILDDSSRQLYSIKTVLIRQEREMELNRGRHAPDTILDGFSEKLDFLKVNGTEYQNLGTFASASRPLFYALPASVGKRNGMHSWDALIPGKEHVPYFKTLSPFTSVRYMQGARQRAMLQTTFAVNPAANFNISGHYQRLTALRILNISSQDERETDHHSAWVSSNFSSRNQKYRLWAHYRHLNHLQYITGGARPGGTGFTDSLFENTNIMRARLNNDARNRDIRNSFLITQELGIYRNFYVRNSFSDEKQVTSYGDGKPDSLYYGKQNFFFQTEGPGRGEPDSLFLRRRFAVFETSVGIGWRDSISDFHLFIKRRDWNFTNDYLPGSRRGSDLIAGFQADGKLAGLSYRGRAAFVSSREYDLSAEAGNSRSRVFFRLFSFLPSLIQETFQSANLVYERNFDASRAVHLRISDGFTFRNLKVSSRVEYLNISRGIAFDSTFTPFQTGKSTVLRTAGIDLESRIFDRLQSALSVSAYGQTGERIAGIPSTIIRTAHWLDLVKRRKSLAAQLGFSLEWRSAWKSEMFSAINAQWYVQQSQKIPSYLLMNAFANVRIDRVRVYLKVHNALQGFDSPGYFAAPGYPAQRRLFEIGIDWTFFD